MTRRRLSPKVYLNPASVWELLDQRNISLRTNWHS